MTKSQPMSTSQRVARRRAALRAEGLKPKQLWVLDLAQPTVRDQISRDCARIASSRGWEDDLAFAEAVQFWPGEEGH